jgi:DNA-binding transcriptional LysR family regulator
VGLPSDTKLVAKRLAETTLVTCAAPDYVTARGAPTAPAELAAHACIAFLSGTGAAEWSFERGAERLGVAPRGALAFNSMEACIDAAIAGLGVTQVVSAFAHHAVHAGRLLPLLDDWAAGGPALYLVHPPERDLSARLAAFIEFARAAFAPMQAERVSRAAQPRGKRRH